MKMRLKKANNQNIPHEFITDVQDVEEIEGICENSTFVVYASESLRKKAKSQVLQSHHGNYINIIFMNTDPIADYLTRIRNSLLARKSSTVVPYSKVKEGITKVLIDRKFLESYKVQNSGKFKELNIKLKSWDKEPLKLKRISRPGQRIYIKSSEIKRVKSGLGVMVISTSKGIMNGETARKEKLGGEPLCEVY